MPTIEAWVYDPTRSLMGRKSDKARRLQVDCENPEGCDLYCREHSCLLQAGGGSCKFGRKTAKIGFTPRARNFHSWIAAEKKACAEMSRGLRPLKARNRIFYSNGHYYLPYAGMSDAFLLSGAPLRDAWVPAEEMTAENLARLCHACPRNIYGERISRYQSESVPKFLADLKIHYPELFELLPQDQKERVATIDYVGRKADVTTLLPGPVTLGNYVWQWDGTRLTRKGSILFQPVPGEAEQVIVPAPGGVAEITSNDQVGPETVLLD